jgi:hypothetical protein
MRESQVRLAGWLGVAIGVVILFGIACLIVFYTVGGPFGTINDVANGAAGVLSGALALALRSMLPQGSPAVRWVAVSAALVGAVVAVIGTRLVESTGFFYAGLVSSVGFGLIGLWVVALNLELRSRPGWASRLPQLGLVAGVIMVIGLLAGLGLTDGVHPVSSAAWHEWIGLSAWLSTYIFYPIWAIWFGRVLLRMDATTAQRTTAA